jgi:hypothetical protein
VISVKCLVLKKIFKNNMLEVNGYKNCKVMEIVRFSDDPSSVECPVLSVECLEKKLRVLRVIDLAIQLEKNGRLE